MRLLGCRTLVAAVAIGLAGGGFAEQALAVELPPLPAVPELPAVPAPDVEVAVPEQAAQVAEIAEVARAEVAKVAEAAPVPAVGAVGSPQQPVAAVQRAPERAAPAVAKQVRHVQRPVRRQAPKARAAKASPRPAVARPATVAEATETSVLLPRRAGALQSPGSPPAPSAAVDISRLQAAPGGWPSALPVVALAAALNSPPDAGARRVPVAAIGRSTLVTTRLERPG